MRTNPSFYNVTFFVYCCWQAVVVVVICELCDGSSDGGIGCGGVAIDVLVENCREPLILRLLL